jgi:hypothetical protein
MIHPVPKSILVVRHAKVVERSRRLAECLSDSIHCEVRVDLRLADLNCYEVLVEDFESQLVRPPGVVRGPKTFSLRPERARE